MKETKGLISHTSLKNLSNILPTNDICHILGLETADSRFSIPTVPTPPEVTHVIDT